MKKGDWIKVHTLEKVKATDDVFGVTRAEEAKKHGVFDEKKKYGPTLVILGAGFIIPGVENHLLDMKVGERKSFSVLPKDAFGPKKRELIRVVPMSKFIEKNISPFPGMPIQIDNRQCKVLFVSGGRVTVDYNHPLAGKELTYEVEITSEVKDVSERVHALMDYYSLEGSVSAAAKKVTITTEKKTNEFLHRLLAETLKKWCGGVDNVEFKDKEKKAEAPSGEEKKESAEKVQKPS